MKHTKTTRIWKINSSKLVVADTVEQAIELWKDYFNIEDEPLSVSAVSNNITGLNKDYAAIIKD